MGIEEGLNIERRIVKTRMPFRVTAFLLGILFVAIGLFQLLGGATDWIAFGFAIFVVKIGLQFVYSALTQQWKSPFEWTRRATELSLNLSLRCSPSLCDSSLSNTDDVANLST